MPKCIEIHKARQNNLKSVDIKIPLLNYTVICGPSGSGKSSLAFDTLFAEGQRRYTETLSNYAKQYVQEMPPPLVENIRNIPPAIALKQNNSVKSARPTLATFTSLADYLRVLFVNLGEVMCPYHHVALKSWPPHGGAKKVLESFPKQKGFLCLPLPSHLTSSQWAGLKTQLLREGLKRILLPSDTGKTKKLPIIKELRELKAFPGKSAWLVLDRLVFEDLARIRDSIRLGYSLSVRYNPLLKEGRVEVFNIKGESLSLSQKPICYVCSYTFSLPLQNSLFNFNSAMGACSQCKGFGYELDLDENKVVKDPDKTVAEGAVTPFFMPAAQAEKRSLLQFCKRKGIDIHRPWKVLSPKQKEMIWKGTSSFMGVKGFFDYLETKKYKMHVRVFLSRFKSQVECPQCKGSRFRKELEHIFFKGKTFPELLTLDVEKCADFFDRLSLTAYEKKKSGEALRKFQSLLKSLKNLGLGYLNLSRQMRTLSSGEFQRCALVHQLGLDLSHMLYVLDEPTVGLHPRDSLKLAELLKQLSAGGNTLVVVEHDPELINQADFIVEMGPQSGIAGGRVVFFGPKKKFLKCPSSVTNKHLTPTRRYAENLTPQGVDINQHKFFLEIKGCKAYNLRNITFRFPLHRLVTVTGVSGSGKSTLVCHTLYPALAKALGQKASVEGLPFSSLKGAEHLKNAVFVNQSPAEKNRRSMVASYMHIYASMRNLMVENIISRNPARLPESMKPSYFSLNVEGGGRCPACQGQGYKEVDMVFLDSFKTLCDECQGKKFTEEALKFQWKGRNIHQILSMTVKEAMDFFVSYPSLWKPLSFLRKVGLEYLVLGQNLSALSGGESQRLKMSRELAEGLVEGTLYILDEPTVGLHFNEVFLLLHVLRDMVSRGGSVLVIEHNVDVMRHSDYLVDLGPGAGRHGGRVVASGRIKDLASLPGSETGHFLKPFLKG